MSFEPQKFFIGLIDFFSVWMPGAVLTYLLKDTLGPGLLGAAYPMPAGPEAWVVFLFASYLLGHFIFLVGSWLDELYDVLRRATLGAQIKRLADGGNGARLSPAWARWLARPFFGNDADRAVAQATTLRKQYLGPLRADSTINTFQWCKARLTLDHSTAIATVQRFEADSKFFRSLVVVLVVALPWGLFTGRPILSLVSVPLLILAFWRYVEQRVKATNQAYWYIITVEGARRTGWSQTPLPAGAGPTHAGGVIFRQSKGTVEYLLVSSKNSSHDLVLPKGHIKPGERPREAAVREAHEEAGVWASVVEELQVVTLPPDHGRTEVQFYLMEAVRAERPDEPGRVIEWLPFEEARTRATYGETRELLTLAESRRAASQLTPAIQSA